MMYLTNHHVFIDLVSHAHVERLVGFKIADAVHQAVILALECYVPGPDFIVEVYTHLTSEILKYFFFFFLFIRYFMFLFFVNSFTSQIKIV